MRRAAHAKRDAPVAAYVVAEYWRASTRRLTVLSLNEPAGGDDEGDPPELWETVADDSALPDLAAWCDARTWLRGFPRRLVAVAAKVVAGQALTDAEHKYLTFWRSKVFRQQTLQALHAAPVR